MKLDFTIEGISDLLTHNPMSMFVSAAGSGAPVKGGKKEPTREEVAEMACYRLVDGSCGIPSLAVRGAVVAAATDYKVPKKRYSLAKLLQGMEIAPMEFLAIERQGGPVTEYVIDTRRAVNKNTKGAIIVHRPKFPAGWQISFSLILDDDLFKNMAAEDVLATITAVLTDAGKRIGIGSYRPANKGWFGKFKVL
jgi:hypothetical protein